MSNTVSDVTGLTYGGLDLQAADLSVHFWIEQGLYEQPDVRGSDSVIPSADGRVPRLRRVDVKRWVLRGLVQGTGVSYAAQKTNFLSSYNTLAAVFDPTLVPQTLAASSPAISVLARFINWEWKTPAPALAGVVAEVSAVLEQVTFA